MGVLSVVRDGLTGTRIRERREISGIKQAELARRVGISPSYLNLIEHNRRRIGGKLLLDIAAVLDVEQHLLSEGAEAALITVLREAADSANLSEAEIRRVEEFVGRFPGWSQVLVDGYQRNLLLERMIETMSDRMAHDPHLAASLHEVLTTTAAIRSTAAILAETPDLEGPLRHRFHANMNQDSERLSDSARTLVRFLEADPGEIGATGTAQDEVEDWLERKGYAFADLENGTASEDALLEEAEFSSAAAQHLARNILLRTKADAQLLGLDTLRAAMDPEDFNPGKLAQVLKVDVPVVLRRLASLPEAGLGLVIADRAGSLLFRKPVDGFAMPRLGAACALWPLFDVISQPGLFLRTSLKQGWQEFDTYSVSDVLAWRGYNRPPLLRAMMLIRPVESQASADLLEVGSTCRICTRVECEGRREPSILSEGL